jgi:hypothetical protein
MLSLISSSCMPFVQIWIPTIDLDQFDKDVIINGGLLCDKHMNAASKLISQQFPAVRGMQNTLLSQMGGFVPIMDNCKLHAIKYNSVMCSSIETYPQLIYPIEC